MPSSHASPSRKRAYASLKLTPPARTDLTSVPVSTSPASTDLEDVVLVARAAILDDAIGASHASADYAIVGGIESPARDEAALGLGQQRSGAIVDRRLDAENVAPLPRDAPAYLDRRLERHGLAKTHVDAAVTPRCPAYPAACAIASSNNAITMPPCAMPRQP